MKPITQKKALDFYNTLIIELTESDDNQKIKQISRLNSLLFNLFNTATKDSDLLRNSSIFDKMKVAFQNEENKQIIDKAHQCRILLNKINNNALRSPVTILDYKKVVDAIASLIEYFSDKPIPYSIINFLSSQTNQADIKDPLLMIDDLDLETNPASRLSVMLVLDTSESMNTINKIKELEKGVKGFFNSVVHDQIAARSVEIAIITFGGNVKKVVSFANIERQKEFYSKLTLEAKGDSPMGEAINFALDELFERKSKYSEKGVSYYQPWLVLMTDGQPTDDISITSQRISQYVDNKKLSVFPIAIGDGPNLETLKRLSPKRNPLKLKGLNFAEFFEWLSQSAKCISQSNPNDKVKLPPTDPWAEVYS